MGRVPASAIALSLLVSGCATTGGVSRHLTARECLARAMYFESNRSSDDGMLAVGTVVMNRYESGKYGGSVCAVVGAPRQFAPGVLSNRITESKSWARATKVAGDVLGGKRHPTVGKAQFFHTEGYQPGYNNMRYVSIEGGNAFYEKMKPGEDPGPLIRVARNGPASIGDLVVVNQASLLGQRPVAPPPPEDDAGPVYGQRPVYAPPAQQAEAAPPGWSPGPSGRIW